LFICLCILGGSLLGLVCGGGIVLGRSPLGLFGERGGGGGKISVIVKFLCLFL